MNFRPRETDEPEINLIPFIDVLLVVIIFLMLSTTYTHFTELQVNLPQANASPAQDKPTQVVVTVAADGRYAVDGRTLEGRGIEPLSRALALVARRNRDTTLVISADGSASHQSVVNVLDAARRVQLVRISFSAQSAGAGAVGGP
jgi:biopolymer transport protein ExbD